MKVRSTLVVAMLLMWTATPVLRCVIPNESLTQEERACCQAMGNNCGDMENHSCCKKTSPASQGALLVASAGAPHFMTEPVSVALNFQISVLKPTRIEFAAPSPPLAVEESSVLKI